MKKKTKRTHVLEHKLKHEKRQQNKTRKFKIKQII